MTRSAKSFHDSRHKNEIPTRLRERRTALDLSRREVAEAIGRSENAIQRWEYPLGHKDHRAIGEEDYNRLMAFYDERERRHAPAYEPRASPAPGSMVAFPADGEDEVGLVRFYSMMYRTRAEQGAPDDELAGLRDLVEGSIARLYQSDPKAQDVARTVADLLLDVVSARPASSSQDSPARAAGGTQGFGTT